MYKVNHLLISLYFHAYAFKHLLGVESSMQFAVETGRARRLYASSLKNFRKVLSSPCAAEDLRPGPPFPCLHLACSSRWCGQKEVSNQLTAGLLEEWQNQRSLPWANCPSIRVDAQAPAPDVQNVADAVVVKDRKHSFVGNLLRPLNVAHADACLTLGH